MNKRHLALAAGVVLALIGFAVVLTSIRPSPGPKIRCSKIAVLGDSLNVTLEVNKRTSKFYDLRPIRLEQWDQNQWTKCFDGIAPFSASGGLGVTQTTQFDCAIRRFPAKTRLRLVIESHRLLQGLDSFPLRARLRLSGRDKRISLNPFYKGLFDTGPVEVVSEEFFAP